MAWREKQISVTKWQALFHHERQVWETDYASVQTIGFDADRYDDQTIKEWVARLISEGEERRQLHAQERGRRTEARKRVVGDVTPVLETEYNGLLDELGIKLETKPLPTTEPLPPKAPRIKASDIDLREIRDGTRIRVKIYPRTFVCPQCGHYQIVDDAISDLVCPCCKTRMEREGRMSGFPRLHQEALIHICPRCAKVEELIPEDIDERHIQDGLLICPRCGGHLHYYTWEQRVSTISWRCQKCGQRYPQRRRPIDRSCSCSIWEPDEEGKRKVSKMYIDRTAASTTYALHFSLLRIKDEPVSLPVLRQRHLDDQAEGIRTWHLNDYLGRLSEPEQKWFRLMFPIREAFLVSGVRSSTVVYGYSTHKAPGQIKENERLPQFFRNERTNTYRAYVVNEQGRALVILLDKERLAQAVQEEIPVAQRHSYDELIAAEMKRLNERRLFQENIDHPNMTPLIAALHAIGHAILKQAMAQVGLDYFGSKILLRDGAIILYEKQDIGYGGVVQLTADAGFLELMNEVERTLSACPHDCEQGCLSCIYINDAWCMPFLPDEIQRWYPPNAILLRKKAMAAMRPLKESPR